MADANQNPQTEQSQINQALPQGPASSALNQVPKGVDLDSFVTEGINLVPPVAKEVVEAEEKKGQFNIGAALLVLFFVLFSVGIISYNIITKEELISLQRDLRTLEQQAFKERDVIYKNDKINTRVQLYTAIEKNTTSYKEVFEYWQDISENLAKITEITLSEDLNFNVKGEANTLLDVAKIWHFLSIDDRVTGINLKSFGTAGEGSKASFEFEGQLNYSYFKKNALSGR